MAPIPWSIDDDKRLRESARSGMGMVEIALHSSRTKSAVRARADKLSIAIARQENPMHGADCRVPEKRTSDRLSGLGSLEIWPPFRWWSEAVSACASTAGTRRLHRSFRFVPLPDSCTAASRNWLYQHLGRLRCLPALSLVGWQQRSYALEKSILSSKPKRRERHELLLTTRA